MTLEQRILEAEQAYAAAVTFDGWKHAAKLLFAVHKRPKKPLRVGGKGRYPFPVAAATFADGVVRRMTFWSAAGKPLDWARAQRLCSLSYALRHGPNIPTIVHLVDEISGEEVVLHEE